ncbi:aminoglycoside adenylyltransferase domain-containing protein [Chengkuizengella axinellae]|uniref:Spectinomycin 9-adenylyltransferase n=1 Tax=Chengkuizengella axinellae TaxID=3064388 RepID=A0ABT9IXU5_9BACL|nr:aminoglycoside adenylyltransferase domain-containing protein [Chengkuizengella sp. 2205SS18-9]MDP5274189.1 DUF4111 domain-containing protein [Chengkuizengella sp. 2205SS18-9]
MDPYKILNTVVDKYKYILNDNLVGIYLHGSLAMGGFNSSSDIDFIVIVNKPINFQTKRELIDVILNLEQVPPKGIEIHIILNENVEKVVHPIPFELHYSNFHKDKYLFDDHYICGDAEDPDLAAHLTIIIHRGLCLYGEEIDKVFGDVPKKVYLESIYNDVLNARDEILEQPVYYNLNLCRVLYYLKENVICSKLEGGEWGKENLPQEYSMLIEDALKIYMNESKQVHFKQQALKDYADYMLNEIESCFTNEI